MLPNKKTKEVDARTEAGRAAALLRGEQVGLVFFVGFRVFLFCSVCVFVCLFFLARMPDECPVQNSPLPPIPSLR